jgi:uncharacterized iron-regulated membrane protein
MNSNDEALATAVKESVSGVHMTVPVEQITSRSRARRFRRRICGMAGALAAVAAVALSATTLMSSGPVASVRLAAWTVTNQPDGNVAVTIRQLRDPAGLEARLRADGIPASVTFAGHRNPACKPDNKDPARTTEQVFQTPRNGQLQDSYTITIRRSAIPGDAGILIVVNFMPSSGPLGEMALGLVHASRQCTGSQPG